MRKYLVVIEKAEHNYSAFSPDVAGCITTGDTLEDTIANMKDALEFHVEALDEIPEAKGLKFHSENGMFDEGQVAEDYFITQLEVRLPAIA
jgi:predicted RNase H-like HicB family nuclease